MQGLSGLKNSDDYQTEAPNRRWDDPPLAKKQNLRGPNQRKIENRSASFKEVFASQNNPPPIFLASAPAESGDAGKTDSSTKNTDVLSRTYTKLQKDFPFSFEYIKKLVSDAGLKTNEIEEVLSKHKGQGRLYTLVAYGILCKAKKNGEVSKRYYGFLNTIAEQIKAGNIHFKKSDQLHRLMAGNTYESSSQTIYYDPSIILETNNLVVIESGIIHELWHAYQDFKKITIRYSRQEAEAHLIQSDFIWHVKPELLEKQYFAHMFRLTKGAISSKFLVPSTVVESLSDLKEDDKALQKAIDQIARKYMSATTFWKIDSRTMRSEIAKEIPSNTPKNVAFYKLKQLVRIGLQMAKKKPLKGHIVCRQDTNMEDKIDGSYYGTCRPTWELTFFSTHVNYFINYAIKKGDLDAAKAISNKYFIDKWDTERDSLLDVPMIDPEIIHDGF